MHGFVVATIHLCSAGVTLRLPPGMCSALCGRSDSNPVQIRFTTRYPPSTSTLPCPYPTPTPTPTPTLTFTPKGAIAMVYTFLTLIRNFPSTLTHRMYPACLTFGDAQWLHASLICGTLLISSVHQSDTMHAGCACIILYVRLYHPIRPVSSYTSLPTACSPS